MIKLEFPSADIITKQGKKGPYYKQVGYAHTLDRDGRPNAYPEQFMVILSKDDSGTPIPYQPGFYKLAPQSIRVGQYKDLEIGFPTLIPIAADQKKAS
ncbi:MAG: G5P family DNA-binding protein [Candidatus Thiodiazotropha sp. (ex Notomyrtea botanica)]|nr:G5P family DNA-binding protein [Candidatus Thiodiazotropha sp. (ex Notomyrtea botanica)]